MVLRILNLEGHQNYIIGSKVTTMYFIHDLFRPFLDMEPVQSSVDNRGVSRGMSVAVGISDRWKVTCDM